MPTVIWSPAALRDVARLFRFLAVKNPDAARRAARTSRQGMNRLSAHTEIGRLMAEMPDHFREWPIRFGGSGYVAFYRVDGNVVVVLAVRHMKEAGYSFGTLNPR